MCMMAVRSTSSTNKFVFHQNMKTSTIICSNIYFHFHFFSPLCDTNYMHASLCKYCSIGPWNSVYFSLFFRLDIFQRSIFMLKFFFFFCHLHSALTLIQWYFSLNFKSSFCLLQILVSFYIFYFLLRIPIFLFLRSAYSFNLLDTVTIGSSVLKDFLWWFQPLHYVRIELCRFSFSLRMSHICCCCSSSYFK